MIEIKKYSVDSEMRMGIWIDNKLIEEVEIHSQFSTNDAKSYLTSKYC